MGFLSNLFRQAGEIKFLTREVNFLSGELEFERQRNRLLELSLKEERRAKDKVLLRHADMMSAQAKVHGSFSNDAEPKKESPVIEPEISHAEMDKIIWAATKMKESDDELGYEDRPLDVYIDIIKQEPSKYIL